MWKCRACQGTYERVQRDGTTYFHVCPPLSQAELQAAVDAGRVTLSAGETVDVAFQRREYERRRKRDENIDLSRVGVTPATIKAEGAGADDLGPSPPRVIVER